MCGALRGNARIHTCTQKAGRARSDTSARRHTYTHKQQLCERGFNQHVYLCVVDFGDEGERVLPGLLDVLDGELDRWLDPLADAAHQGRFVHGHKYHYGQVFSVSAEPAVVLSVFCAIVAHLGQSRVKQQNREKQASRREEHLQAAAVPPGWSHATARGDQITTVPSVIRHRKIGLVQDAHTPTGQENFEFKTEQARKPQQLPQWATWSWQITPAN